MRREDRGKRKREMKGMKRKHGIRSRWKQRRIRETTFGDCFGMKSPATQRRESVEPKARETRRAGGEGRAVISEALSRLRNPQIKRQMQQSLDLTTYYTVAEKMTGL